MQGRAAAASLATAGTVLLGTVLLTAGCASSGAAARGTAATAATTAELRGYQRRLNAANKPVEDAVRVIRSQLGLPPPDTSSPRVNPR